MNSYEEFSEMFDISLDSVFDEFYGEFNLRELVESANSLKGTIHEKTKSLIDNLFEWIPRLIRRLLNVLRNKVSTSPDERVVIRNENDNDAVLIWVLDNTNSAGNALRDIIDQKKGASTIRLSESYSRTLSTSELHTLNLMIKRVREYWRREKDKKNDHTNDLKHFQELARILAAISKSLQKLLKQISASKS